jgi:hypothetical protein
MSAFLTVKEAAVRTGKSPSSIRRVIYPIIHDDNHPDRVQVQPSVEDALKLRMQGENFAWRISEELLRREIPEETDFAERVSGASGAPLQGDAGPLLSMLQSELEIKNKQITQQGELIGKQMELISGLSERLREGNILIGTLQRQFTLTDGREQSSAHAVTVEPPPAVHSRAQRRKVKKKAEPPPAVKKGFFRWLFRQPS